MSLTFEPKTSRDALAPTDPETLAAQAALYLHAADPSAVFAKHDAIAEGRTPRPRPVLARELTPAFTDRMPPQPAPKPSLRARLRHALSWKG